MKMGDAFPANCSRCGALTGMSLHGKPICVPCYWQSLETRHENHEQKDNAPPAE